jgi:hypothetical protein
VIAVRNGRKERYLDGTDPTEFVDYTTPENDVNSLK